MQECIVVEPVNQWPKGRAEDPEKKQTGRETCRSVGEGLNGAGSSFSLSPPPGFRSCRPQAGNLVAPWARAETEED